MAGVPEPPVVGDVESRRSSVSRLFDRVLASQPPVEGVEVDTAVSRLAIAARVRRLRLPDPQ